MKLSNKKIKTINRNIDIAERKMQEALTYVDKVTNLLKKYGICNIIAVYHHGDGVLFQPEDDPMSDLDFQNLVDYLEDIKLEGK